MPRPGTTVQLPTFGVAIDADGVVADVVVSDPDGRLARERKAAAVAKLPGDVGKRSLSRKVSLQRLGRVLRAKREAGEPPDDAMAHLAGLQRIEAVYFYPEANEIVVAGPAEGWAPDAVGRTVGVDSGRPTLRLDDLAVSLRAYPPAGPIPPFVGCTIVPPREGWERFVAFQKTIPRSVPEAARGETAVKIAQGSREALGVADIRTFGVSAATHLGAVMVEADYRMKRIAIGLEPPPTRMKSYLDLLKGAPKRQSAQRWWFVPEYERITTTEDGLAMRLDGDGVVLSEENQFVSADGVLTPDGTIDGAAQAFAAGFTREYGAIASASPVFAELRNAVDLLIVAAFIRDRKLATAEDEAIAEFLDEEHLPTENLPAPRKVASVVNAVWKGARLLAPVGGVTIQAEKAMEKVRTEESGELAGAREKIAMAGEEIGERWWWD